MPFFDNMNRKQKRKFNKLSPDEQAPIIEAELIQKVSPIMADQIAKSMITGMDILWQQLFEDYVKKIDEAKDDDVDYWVNTLISTIRTQHLRIEAQKARENKDEIRED